MTPQELDLVMDIVAVLCFQPSVPEQQKNSLREKLAHCLPIYEETPCCANEPQSLREHANEALKPEDCFPDMSLQELAIKFPERVKEMIADWQKRCPSLPEP